MQRNGHDAEQLPNTLSVRFPRARGTALLDATPEVAASTGSACHEGHESASSVLLAMGLAADEALETVRLSVGTTTTPEEIARAAAALVSCLESGRRTTMSLTILDHIGNTPLVALTKHRPAACPSRCS